MSPERLQSREYRQTEWELVGWDRLPTDLNIRLKYALFGSPAPRLRGPSQARFLSRERIPTFPSFFATSPGLCHLHWKTATIPNLPALPLQAPVFEYPGK